MHAPILYVQTMTHRQST